MRPAILQRLKREGTPLLEEGGVVFVWRGSHPPRLVGDFTDWENGPTVGWELAGRSMWMYRLELPPDAYIEYAFLEGDDRVSDVHNPRTVPNGLGDYNHYFSMPAYQPTELISRKRSVPRGLVTSHKLPTGNMIAGETRSVTLYQPPVDEPCPLVVVWDGRDYLLRGCLPVIVDNLIAARRIRPIALAMVENGRSARIAEYACSEGTLGFLKFAVLPLAQQFLNLVDISKNPGAYGVMGSSMGGLMALFTALRMPEIFSNVLSESGAFSSHGSDSVVFDLVKLDNFGVLRVWLDVGRYDFTDLITANPRMADHLQAQGHQVAFRQYSAGHNYTAWRDTLASGLEFLFAV